VASLEPGGPAETAGLREQDLIVAWDSRPIAGIEDLQRALSEAQPGSAATVTLIRGTEKLELKVVPSDRPIRR
jgi:serine protease Do